MWHKGQVHTRLDQATHKEWCTTQRFNTIENVALPKLSVDESIPYLKDKPVSKTSTFKTRHPMLQIEKVRNLLTNNELITFLGVKLQ